MQEKKQLKQETEIRNHFVKIKQKLNEKFKKSSEGLDGVNNLLNEYERVLIEELYFFDRQGDRDHIHHPPRAAALLEEWVLDSNSKELFNQFTRVATDSPYYINPIIDVFTIIPVTLTAGLIATLIGGPLAGGLVAVATLIFMISCSMQHYAPAKQSERTGGRVSECLAGFFQQQSSGNKPEPANTPEVQLLVTNDPLTSSSQ